MGAAVQGAVMAGDIRSLVLLDVTPLSLGIETVGDVFSRIIERNTTLPIERSQIFTTAANFQTSVEVHVLQGERSLASGNKTLGKFRLDGIRRAPRGVPQIEVTFSIDSNGIVTVRARDLGTGREQHITITNSSNMSQEEIARAMRDAEEYAAQDALRRDEAALRNRAEALIYQAERAQKKLQSEDQKRLKEPIQRVQKALAGQDTAGLKAACDDLEQLLESIGYHSGDSSDGSYDADYTEN